MNAESPVTGTIEAQVAPAVLLGAGAWGMAPVASPIPRGVLSREAGVGGLSHRSPLAATRSLARGMPTGPTSFRNEFQKSGSKENL